MNFGVQESRTKIDSTYLVCQGLCKVEKNQVLEINRESLLNENDPGWTRTQDLQ